MVNYVGKEHILSNYKLSLFNLFLGFFSHVRVPYEKVSRGCRKYCAQTVKIGTFRYEQLEVRSGQFCFNMYHQWRTQLTPHHT